jgi:hypothetical protein
MFSAWGSGRRISAATGAAATEHSALTATAEAGSIWRSETIRDMERALERLRQRGGSLRRLALVLGPAASPLLLLLLSLPNAVPVGPPGTGLAFALPITVLALTLLRPKQRLALPSWLARRRLNSEQLQRLLPALDRLLATVERVGRPRLTGWLRDRRRWLMVGMIVLMALLILAPLPTGNPPAAVAIIAFAAGMLREDGLLVLAGHLVGVLAVAWNALIAVLIFVLGVQVWSLF